MGLQYSRLWFIRYCTRDVELICLELSSLLPGDIPDLCMLSVLLWRIRKVASYFEGSFEVRVFGNKVLSVMVNSYEMNGIFGMLCKEKFCYLCKPHRVYICMCVCIYIYIYIKLCVYIRWLAMFQPAIRLQVNGPILRYPAEVYIYIYTHIYTHIYKHIYTYI